MPAWADEAGARFGNLGLRTARRTAGFLVVSRRLDRHDLLSVNAELRGELLRLRRELERLRVENEVLQEAAEPLIHRAPAHERFAFIHRLRGRFTVKRLCRILAVSRCSGKIQNARSGQRIQRTAGIRHGHRKNRRQQKACQPRRHLAHQKKRQDAIGAFSGRQQRPVLCENKK